ncbi:hypothetical protein [Desmonostoc muscorum]|uniref:hypothetical protein n=1 Tax=Desmonostoc muscorum TaxID=1179 RepID=UPI001F3DE81C|nr:hypothetical protein [Desmonostoc muscorum]
MTIFYLKFYNTYLPDASNREPQVIAFIDNMCDCLLTQPFRLGKPLNSDRTSQRPKLKQL